MKIAWFSPRAPAHSDVANFTQRLEGELRQRFDVRFFVEQPAGFYEPDADQFFPVSLGHSAGSLLVSLNATDLAIYNLGNNPEFFAKTWFLSQQKPGVVILHDLKLHHFFEGIYRERLDDRPAYLALMDQYYGELGLDAGENYWRQQISIDFMAEHFPMTTWAVRNALALVVHTPYAVNVLRQETDAPVWLNALAYAPKISQRPASDLPPLRGDYTSAHPARLAVFGYLNVNRRVVELLQAIAGMEERTCFELHIFGQLWQSYEQDVQSNIDQLGLGACVKLHGYVSEEELDAGLASSDLAINLRFPTMGESSGSQLRIWDHALPSLVTRIGGYATMPEDAVSFVRPDHEREDVQQHLRDFLARPEFYRRKGARGRQVLLERHQPSEYVERLGQLCELLPDLVSRRHHLLMADRIAEAMAPWSVAMSEAAYGQHYATTVTETF